jgi:hypothetical protein
MEEEHVEAVEGDEDDRFEYCVMGRRGGPRAEEEREDTVGEQDQPDEEDEEEKGEEGRADATSETHGG